MRPGHHHVAGRAGLGLRDHVARLHGLGLCGELHRCGSDGGTKQRAVCFGHADNRDLDIGGLAQGAAHLLLDDVVGHHDRDGAALCGCGFLLGERAGASIHQHHSAVDR